ncbi:glycosyltransferase family 2 protein [Pararoseomonas indoligenes]|uniref:Glycosyltransferase family 2 protein n=1 Tax=Roseomonas indoligenes TaxID=2820811 RepID=A0A940S748_9PROT|nr:glycosyltransferase family 2 protein [Pararoseomonas indoligenes]MBP0496241.1 glycosyltransferase family 2 protein [Pararoseomonas indoligenes]
MPTREPLSVVIMTKNEAERIGHCVRSALAVADEVIVLDSGSQDGTREAATAAGARVFEQPWLGFVGQRQRAVDLAAHDWVLCLDADEFLDAELRTAVQRVLQSSPDPRDGYALDRRDEFFGRLFPSLKNQRRKLGLVRLFHRRHSRWNPEQLIHEEVLVHGRKHLLPGVLVHWRNFTLAGQTERHVTNAELEAEQLDRAGKSRPGLRLLLMPPARFVWIWAVKGGWRLGTAGFVVAVMGAHAEFMRWATLWEKREVRRQVLPPAELLGGGDGRELDKGPAPEPIQRDRAAAASLPHLSGSIR